MNKEDNLHIKSFRFYDRDELEELTKEYYLENKQLKGSLQTHEILLRTNVEENQRLREKMDKAFRLLQVLHYKFDDNDSIHNDIEEIQKILKDKDNDK